VTAPRILRKLMGGCGWETFVIYSADPAGGFEPICIELAGKPV